MRAEWDHRIGHNAREWSPSRVIFFDTETGSQADDYGQTLPLRSWEACAVWRDKPEGHRHRERWQEGTTGLELAQWLESVVTTEKSVWLFAHNLGFDLTTTRLPLHMIRLGWEQTRGTLTSDSPWVSWRKGNKSLTAVDSMSHLPSSLAKIGDKIGLPKLHMPAFDAPAAEWDVYRHRDVDILRTAMLALLDWWDAEKLGNFSVSGASTGWNCWRHTTDHLAVRIDPDPEQRKWGREAIYGGRRSCWQTGELRGGPWVEIDISLAHLNIMRHELTPVSVLGWVQSVPLGHKALRSDRAGLVADCTVRTDRARYPVQTRQGVVYPTGEFRTRLAGPELREALERGELVEVRRALAVTLGRPMRQWADWLHRQLTVPASEVSPAVLLAQKGWSRATIGKWAAKTSREVMRYPWPMDGWRIETGFLNTPSQPSVTCYMEGEAAVYVRDQEGHDSFPAAYAWITAHMRTVLNRLIELVGAEHMVSCNTDSVVVDIAALRPWAAPTATEDDEVIISAVEAIQDRLAPYTLAVKAVATELRIKTAEHMVYLGQDGPVRKLAGVGSRAEEVDPWTFQGDVWPGLVKQLSFGQGEQFRLTRRKVRLDKARPFAWVLPDGRCEPPRMVVDNDGHNRIVRPDWLDVSSRRARTASRQHAGLVGML